MQIQQLTIKNFKKFRECRIDFDPHFNLFVGDNATGKTSVLDALSIAIDAWFLGMRAAEKAGGIDGDQVHLLPVPQPDSTTFEKQFPSSIEAKGLVQGQPNPVGQGTPPGRGQDDDGPNEGDRFSR